MVRWMALLAMGNGVLNAGSMVVYAAYRGFPLDMGPFGSPAANKAFSFLLAAMALTELVGGWGLLKWKSWGRTVLIVGSAVEILSGFIAMILSLSYFSRQIAPTTQPGYRPEIGLWIWNYFRYWA